MCGIAGILNFKLTKLDTAAISSMTNAMAHRGPDAEGFFKDDYINLGHRRLSIIDLSANANQPLHSSCNNYVIVFNGEIYNYSDVKSKLSNYAFKTNSDTEVVLAAFITWGKDALQHLLGMFAFCIYSKLTKEVFIARDRLGVKPIYYYNNESYFLFASELRAMLQSGLVPKVINTAALDNYFATQSFAAPTTIISNVLQLNAGCYINVSSNNISEIKYWDITKPSQKFEYSSKITTQQQVKKLLEQSVERRLVSDVPVAAFLSGGIDSSAIVGLMAQHTNRPETFNIAFDEEEFDESYYAEIIAKKFNTIHHKIVLKPENFLEQLPSALHAMDIPSGDGINSYVVSKEIVKHGIKVAMSGVGGDELFAGYPSFLQWYKINKYKKFWKIPQPLRRIAASFLPDNEKNKRIKSLLNTSELNSNMFYPLVRQVISPATIAAILSNNDNSNKNLRSNNNCDFPLLSQFSIAELTGYTHNTLLKDTDQFSMANSLEVREPFFDHELVEYVLQIPDKYKYPTFPKQLLVESLGYLLPPEIVHRKKKGFTFPWKHWLKNELKEFCEAKIKGLSQRNFMQEKNTLQLWHNFLNDKDVRWSEVWTLVVLENWLEINVD